MDDVKLIDVEAFFPSISALFEIGEICVAESKFDISSDDALRRIRICLRREDVFTTISKLQRYMDDNPVEAKPVVHAHWIVTEKYGVKDYVCGNCSDEEYWQKHCLNHNANFCPHCGAKMD